MNWNRAGALTSGAAIFTVLTLLNVGCKPSAGSAYQPKPQPKLEMASVKEGADQNLVPFVVGNQWTYELQQARITKRGRESADPITQTMKVTDVQRGADGTKASIDVLQDGKVVDHQVWLANAKGLYQLSVGSVPFDPPQPVVLFPISSNQSFKWSGTGIVGAGKSGRSDAVSKVDGQQTVDTGTGSLMALAVTSSTSIPGSKTRLQGTVWLAPGIGIARLLQDSSTTDMVGHIVLKLKGHSLKR